MLGMGHRDRIREAMQAVLDSRSLEVATNTAAEIRLHKEECRERYLSIDGKMNGLDSKMTALDTKLDTKLDAQDKRFDSEFGNLYRFLWKIAGGIIMMLLALCAWLAIQIYTNVTAGRPIHGVAASSYKSDRC